MKSLFLFITCFFLVQLHAQFDDQHYSKLKISLEDKDIKDLASLGLEVDHGTIKIGKYIINDFSEYEIELISNAGFEFEILIEDVKTWYKDQSRGHSHENQLKSTNNACNSSASNAPVYETPANYTYGSMGGYLTYSEMIAVLDQMVALYPSLITPRNNIGNIADSTWMGNRIFWMKISDNANIDEQEPEVLFTSLHHAREPNSLSQNIFYMWYLLENYDNDLEIKYLVDETEIYFIPCVNPDGYILNELNDPTGGGLIRKNGRDNNNNGTYEANQDGVDLNRNYGYQFAYDNNGSSPNTSSQTYRGPSAFSEPETRAVKMFCDAHEIEITLNYHTYGNLLIHPWGYSDVITSEHATFSVFGEEMTQYNNYVFGTGSMTVGYEVNGDSDDWMYGETVSKGKIYSMTPEAGDESAQFWPASSDIDQFNKANMHQNLSASRLVLNYVEGVEVNANNIIDSYTGTFQFEFEKKGLKAGNVFINFNALNSNLNLNITQQTLSLAHLGTQSISVPYTINPAATHNEMLDFVVSIDNGLFTYFDTIRKTYKKTPQISLFEDIGTDLNNWIGNGWEVTFSDFYSSPSSITESPLGDYSNNQDKRLTTKNAIDLTSAESASISFWAKWDIENDYDYTQVLISIDGGTSYIPLCGNYTNLGSADQDEDNPLYDNIQNDWVNEIIDISDYVGNEVLIQFYFHSDGGVTEDGFYFDDFKVFMFEAEDNTNIKEINTNYISIYPVPTEDELFIELLETRKKYKIEVFNTIGENIEVKQKKKDKNTQVLDVSNLGKGLYFVKYSFENDYSIVKFLKK